MAGKTQRKRSNKTRKEKAAIWNQFDDEVGNLTKPTLECLYQVKEDVEFCTMCNSSLIFNDENLLTCSNPKCAIIYSNIIDDSAEWRFYGGDGGGENPARCGMPVNPLLRESSYGCKVLCNGKSSYEMRKIRRYTSWQSMPYREKSNYDDFQHIIALASTAGIPKIIIDEALRYHKDIIKQKTFRGINRDGIIAASIYIACRVHNHPRTPKELATIFNLDNSSATKGCKNAIKLLNTIECDLDEEDKTQFTTTKPEAFIDRFCSRLNFNEELVMLCKFITSRIEQIKLVQEKAPQSVAAGVIYFVAQTCNQPISKTDIHKISKISEVTINKCYKILDERQKDLIPRVILEKYGS